MGNLNDVQEQLRADFKQVTGEEAQAPSARLVVAAEKMPLSHRAGRPEALVKQIVAGTSTLQPGHDSDRELLGTDGNVFTWVGPSRFLEPALVLFFSDGLDDSLAAACQIAPWDTKGTKGRGVLGRHVATEQAAREIQRFSLPPTEARRFLAQVLACAFSGSTSAYLEGDAPLRCYPGRNCIPFARTPTYEETPAYTFEARFSVPIDFADELDAILLDPFSHWATPMSQPLSDLKRWCACHRVRLKLLDRGDTMQEAVVRETHELLSLRGAE